MEANADTDTQTNLRAAIEALRVSEQRLAVATEALRKSEERGVVGRLALEVMHEVKNPLEALGHLTYLTLEEADRPEMVRKYMLLAKEQMSNLGHIAKYTLGFAQQSEKPRPVDLVTLAEAALRIHQRTIQEKRIHLVKHLQSDAVTEGYRGEMLQVVSNLIVNALDALPDDGVLHLRLRKRKTHVELVIADNGHGISPEHNDGIFQPFFTTKADGGTGLGLALSKRIIERHHGKICVRSSVRPGKSGTAFKISLPRA